MAALVDITTKHIYQPLVFIETLQTVTLQTVNRTEAVQPLVSFLDQEMKAGGGGIGFKRKIIVRSTYQKLHAKINEEVEEEVSITVLPPRRGTVENTAGELQFLWPKSYIDVPSASAC